MKITVYTTKGEHIREFDNIPEKVANAFTVYARKIYGENDSTFGYMYNDSTFDITVDKAIKKYHMDEIITEIIVTIMTGKNNYYTVEESL